MKSKTNIVRFLNLQYRIENDFEMFRSGDVVCSYNEFMERVVAAACAWERKGVFQQGIAIKASHNIDTLVAFMGILLSGNYYVPLPDEAPEGFLNTIEKQSDFIKSWEVGVEQRLVNQEDYDRLLEKLDMFTGVEPAYMIFTSGSTGSPKGILKSHRSMISFLTAYQQEFQFRKDYVIGNQTPFYFDASAKDIYMTLYCKCSMVILDASLFVHPQKLVTYMNETGINCIQWVPSALSMVSRFDTFELVKPLYLRQIFFVGEIFPVKELLKWMEALPDTEFINLYGSSEIAGICAFSRIDYEEQKHKETIPIGKPLSNSEIRLIDNEGNIIRKTGCIGEMYIYGDAVADGYYRNPEKSAEVFPTHSFEDEAPRVYYRSGDMAQWDGYGRLEFVNRGDDQIKHMGHRIELGEIEAAVLRIDTVREACCIFESGKIVLAVAGEADKAYITRCLKEQLPRYMIPNRIRVIDEIPYNLNGKKDRIELRKMLGL